MIGEKVILTKGGYQGSLSFQIAFMVWNGWTLPNPPSGAAGSAKTITIWYPKACLFCSGRIHISTESLSVRRVHPCNRVFHNLWQLFCLCLYLSPWNESCAVWSGFWLSYTIYNWVMWRVLHSFVSFYLPYSLLHLARLSIVGIIQYDGRYFLWQRSFGAATSVADSGSKFVRGRHCPGLYTGRRDWVPSPPEAVNSQTIYDWSFSLT